MFLFAIFTQQIIAQNRYGQLKRIIVNLDNVEPRTHKNKRGVF